MRTRRQDLHLDAAAGYPPFLAKEPKTPCLDRPDLFTKFEDRGGTRLKRETLAVRVCAPCPVKAACRAWATRTRQVGVWGGTTERERGNVAHAA